MYELREHIYVCRMAEGGPDVLGGSQSHRDRRFNVMPMTYKYKRILVHNGDLTHMYQNKELSHGYC